MMRLPVRPLAASAVGDGGGGGFSAVLPRYLRERSGRTCRKVVGFSSSGKGSGEEAAQRETPEEARRRLAELDALLEGLVEPKMRPPTPPPPPDPYMDRDMITGRAARGSTDELPEFSPTYVAFSTMALVILTIFTNVMFNLYVKPSVDGVDQPVVRIQRVPLVNPADRQVQ